MHRLIVLLLAAFDAAIAVAVAVAATLASLTLLWIFGFGDAADWAALWPVSAVIWQFGNLTPLQVTIPADYLAVTGIDPDAASFTLSLAPLAFATFTAIFAARSGTRASRADAWITGVMAGSAAFAALALVLALTSVNPVAEPAVWQAVLFPTLVFALPSLTAAVVTEWREADRGWIARVRDRVEEAPRGWGAAPGLVARGAAIVVAGLVGLGALLVAVSLVLRGDEVIALYEAAHLDVLGATLVTLAQLAYLPTIVVWGIAFVAGPGFALGEGGSVSPAGTQVGVVPGIPILGIVPESTTPWLLLLALCPIALGAFAGWMGRSSLVARLVPARPATPRVPDAALDPARASALAGLLAHGSPQRTPDDESAAAPGPEATASDDPIGARLVVTLGIAVVAAGAAALLAAVASGSIGPGSLTVMGPAPGPVALTVGLEVVLGAGILLLSPRPRRGWWRSSPRTRTRAAGEDRPAEGDTLAPRRPEGREEQDRDEPPALPADRADTAREPFTFPTLPRIPSGPQDHGGTGQDPPVD